MTSEGHDASEDGTGRGTPIVAIPISMQNAGRLTTEPGSRAGDSSGTGIGEDGEASYTITSTVPAVGCVVTPLALRGREHGAELEAGEPNAPYNALRAGDGASSRQSLISVERHTETVVRRLTELECERLQGFPDNWTDGQSGSARYRQLGNSVAVPCVEWIARRLVTINEELDR